MFWTVLAEHTFQSLGATPAKSELLHEPGRVVAPFHAARELPFVEWSEPVSGTTALT